MMLPKFIFSNTVLVFSPILLSSKFCCAFLCCPPISTPTFNVWPRKVYLYLLCLFLYLFLSLCLLLFFYLLFSPSLMFLVDLFNFLFLMYFLNLFVPYFQHSHLLSLMGRFNNGILVSGLINKIFPSDGLSLFGHHRYHPRSRTRLIPSFYRSRNRSLDSLLPQV